MMSNLSSGFAEDFFSFNSCTQSPFVKIYLFLSVKPFRVIFSFDQERYVFERSADSMRRAFPCAAYTEKLDV